MGISKNGLELIKKFEGRRLTAYQDAVGVWTIGYGHTKGVRPGMTITVAEADKMLEEDANEFYKYVTNPKYVPVTKQLNQNQKDALTSFAFNLGQNNLKTLCAGRNVETIGRKMTLYVKAGGKTLPGLVERRKAEQALYNKSVKKKSRYYKKCPGSCETITEGLDTIKVDSSYAKRAKIAKKNGIKDYSGTREQNHKLLALLKVGKLKTV